MRNKLKKIVVKKYSMRYYIDLLFKTSLWNTPEEMNTYLLRSIYIIGLFFIIGISSFILWVYARAYMESHFQLGKNAWVLIFTSIVNMYAFINSLFLYIHRKIYQKSWHKTKCYDKLPPIENFIKKVIILINLIWIIPICLIARILKQNNMLVLFEHGFDLIESVCISVIFGPLIAFILLRKGAEVFYPTLSDKASVHLFIFLCFLFTGWIQSQLLKIFLELSYKKDPKKVVKLHAMLKDKFQNIILFVAWIIIFILGLIEVRTKTMNLWCDGLLHTTTLITVWIALKDRIDSTPLNQTISC